jgi:large subunit ribosomal protein L24
MLKFKVGDTVTIMSGKDRGRKGKIEKIFPKKSLALIPGINVYKKHVKGFSGQKGGIYDIPKPIVFAKIALVCPKCKKQTRVGFKMAGNEKVRACKKCNKEIIVKKAKKK